MFPKGIAGRYWVNDLCPGNALQVLKEPFKSKIHQSFAKCFEIGSVDSLDKVEVTVSLNR